MAGCKRMANAEGTRNFKNRDLRNLDLSDLDFSGSSFVLSNFYGANLQGSNFSNSDFRFATLWDANLKYANFSSSKLKEAKFSFETDLRFSCFDNADLCKTDLRQFNHQGVSLKNTYIDPLAKVPSSRIMKSRLVVLKFVVHLF